MGYHPVNEKLNRYYTIGFNVPNKISDEAFTMAEAKGMYTESDGCFNNMPPEDGKTFFSAGKYYATEIAKKENMEKNQIGDQRTEETQTFTIEAVGVIGFDYGNTDRFSRLAIDQAGTIRVESPGY